MAASGLDEEDVTEILAPAAALGFENDQRTACP